MVEQCCLTSEKMCLLQSIYFMLMYNAAVGGVGGISNIYETGLLTG